ncbi:hypothetical protein UPYG_G00257420 [Umbra pygmaea]|uniref:NHS-like protein 1 n=1 Tax=Umbra pygmaea TaxID=75934 RepID=A0ABD0WU63_UMBPY
MEIHGFLVPASTLVWLQSLAVSNLDEESKWTVHYTAPWHQQENVFLPGSRPPCVEDLHRQAKVNLKTALRECDKLRKDGFRSSQYYSQGPTFSGRADSQSSLQDDQDDTDKKSMASSAEDDKSLLSVRPQSPQEEEEGIDECDGQLRRHKVPPLPTPEEKMRMQAQAVPTDIIPINVTGATFDRQASIRRSLINTDTVSRRPKKVKRRKTISGLPDNICSELAAKGHGGELRPHSMFIPGQYSTLGRVGSVNSTLRHSETRDSGCQTEEVKIVPPSMRRIRAQRGQGIAAQMAGLSTSSSTGSISVSSSDGFSRMANLPYHLKGDSQRFHSLPRHGARVSLSAEPIHSSTPIRPEDCNASQRQIGKLQVDDTVVHLRSAPRTDTLPRPKSQEVRGCPTQTGEWGGGPACVVSPHAAYSTSLLPNATMSCSAEVVALNTSTSQHTQSPRMAYPASRPFSLSAGTSADPLSSNSFNQRAACPGQASSTSTQIEPQNGGEVAPGKASDSGHSDGSMNSHSSTVAATPPSSADDQWSIYDTPENVVLPRRPLTSSCSTPINHLYSSLELSSRTTTDSSSLYSQDNDGYYTSMHMDSGLRSRSHGSGQGHGTAAGRTARHSMYECRELASHEEDTNSLYSERSLSRSISLRKAKKPPLPPARTDSLRRKPGGKKPLGGVSTISGVSACANGSVLNETLIASLQQSLQMGLRGGKGVSPSSASHSPCSEYEDPWLLRPRSQSSISSTTSLAATNTAVANVYSLCNVTPAHSDTSSLRSDYAESWGYYMDYPLNNGDQGPKSTSTNQHHPTADVLAGTQPQDLSNGSEQNLNKTQAPIPPAQEGVAVKAKMATSSPDRIHRLTSPSSGYSSQSNTPTAGTPVPSFMRSHSPSGRSKPKSVHLRSVKWPEKQVNSNVDCTKLHTTGGDQVQVLEPQTMEKPKRIEHPTTLTLINFTRPEEITEDLSSAKKLFKDGGDSEVLQGDTIPVTKHEDQSDDLVQLGMEEELSPLSGPLVEAVKSSPVKQKPPVASKKPKLYLTSVLPLQAEKEESPQVSPTFSPQEEITITTTEEDQVDGEVKGEEKQEKERKEQGENEFSGSSESSTSTDGQQETQPSASVAQETIPTEAQGENGESEQEDDEEDEEEDGDGTSSTSGSVSSKDEESGEVFEPISAAESSLATGTDRTPRRGDMVTPTRPRTTEDLFAAIHRSKRKVLGRKESEEEKQRGSSPCQSPPVTPTGTPPALASPAHMGRQAGSIQRNLRKSATSSDTFKALLLKKGSRSETSFRMSAAEMLRSTDPRFQRTRSESSLDPPLSPSSPTTPHSSFASPGRGKRTPEEWARGEGLSYTSSSLASPPPLSGMKYGRSRTPPSAASSKYNARNRILSSPMTVICEREGELAESAEYDIPDGQPSPLSMPMLQDCNGTLPEESNS